jgi:cell cycle sensor histidine kinase DivJ
MAPQAARAGIELASAVEPGLPELNADRRAVRQILLNLLSNAVKFTGTGGRVECGARREDRAVLLWVRDTGIGIAPDDIPRLGAPFFQAETGYNRRHEGAGLGLSVVKGLVRLHGGTVSIDSAPGAGTTVTVTLPGGAGEAPQRGRSGLAAADGARAARRA